VARGVKKGEAETFTDEQVTRACGLHLDNLRRLITWGAVTPAQSGGGRGRVRKWTARQALRISVTAQFVEVGFSLQMAHTLTYCLPLDDLLYAYDPAVLRTHLKGKRDRGSLRFKAMIERDATDYWPSKQYLGSEVFFVDRWLLYADVLGDSPTLLAIIDQERQRIYPRHNPYEFLYGAGMVVDFGLPKVVDARKISRKSLLIDDEYLAEPFDEPPSGKQLDRVVAKELRRFEKKIPRGVDTQLSSAERLVCRNLIAVNLAVGLTAFVRQLLGLPVNYHPMEEQYDHD
jgi:hypothetical protein